MAQDTSQWDASLRIHKHAHDLGDVPTRLVSREEAARRELDVKADTGAVESETSGIVDSHAGYGWSYSVWPR